MGYKLCTAEKPSVAKDIARVVGANTRKEGYFEGNGYLVTWAVGHLVGLAEPDAYGFVPQKDVYGEKGEIAYNELPLIPSDFKLIVLEQTKQQFAVIKELMNRDDVDYIIDCGDMGAEGHILQWFIREKIGCKKPVKRFCATSMTDEAIKRAMANLRPSGDFTNIINGEFCKKKADWIMGMSLSRVESIKYRTGINVGRVQSPTLYFVVKRYLEVQKFKVTNYYTFDVDCFEGFHVFWNKDTDGKFLQEMKDSEGRLLNAKAAQSKAQEILKGKIGTISALDRQKKATDRPQLYDITELQRDANRKYGYTAAVTLATAQALYETQKVLSYPRTDSRYITTDLQPYMAERINAIGTLKKYRNACNKLLNEGLNIDKKIIDDSKVTDHHALIPTEKIRSLDFDNLVPTFEEKKKGVTTETMRNVLDLILCRVIIAFSKPFFYEQTTINVTFPNGFVFSASGKKYISLGWKAVQNELSGKEEDSGEMEEEYLEQIFPSITKGQMVTVRECAVLPKKTTLPKLHTEATLLSAMENAGASIENGAILKGKGIGTQATRAEIIKKLFDAKYVETEKRGKTNYIKPTSKGMSIIRVLPPDVYSPRITADWETKIAAIAEGKSTETDFMHSFNNFIREKVREVKEIDTGVVFKQEREVFGICPWCGSDVFMYQKKDDSQKVLYHSYYCSDRCGFNLQDNDNTFISRIKRKITVLEAKKFISKKFITLSCKKKSSDGTYMGEFTFEKREVDGKSYCNIMCKPISLKK